MAEIEEALPTEEPEISDEKSNDTVDVKNEVLDEADILPENEPENINEPVPTETNEITTDEIVEPPVPSVDCKGDKKQGRREEESKDSRSRKTRSYDKMGGPRTEAYP